MFSISINENRIFGLDLLRAFAIITVVYSHSIHLLFGIIPDKYLNLFIFDGVTFFFVLSGFLIGSILLKLINKEVFYFRTLFNFWVRRWFRTLPNYFLILILLIILTNNFNGSVIKYFFFLQNFNQPHPVFFAEAWSLSVEEWFYLLVPVILFICVKFCRISFKILIPRLLLLLIIIISGIRLYNSNLLTISNLKDWDLFLRKTVLTRLDSIMFGVLGASISVYYKDLWSKYKTILLIVGISIILSMHFFFLKFHIENSINFKGISLFMNVFYFSTFSFAILLLLPFLSTYKKTNRRLLFKVVTVISIISYSMYLIHYSLVINIIMPFATKYINAFIKGNLLAVFQLILIWLMTFSLSVLLYKYFEKPIMDLRDRI
jgi:peptidoglycan/LPS O-acetylase OafA/YrhL